MELDPRLIAAAIALLVAITALIKQITDNLRIKAQRAETKAVRDDDSLKIHDTLLRHDFLISQIKDNQALTATVVDDLRDTCSTLNSNIVKLDSNVENLTKLVDLLRK